MSNQLDDISLAQQSWSFLDLLGRQKEWAPRRKPRVVTASTNVNPLDDSHLVDCTAGAVTLTLETAVAADGRKHWFKKTDSSSNAMTVAGLGSQLVELGASVSTTVQGITFVVWSAGLNWFSVVLQPGVPSAVSSTYTNSTPVPTTIGGISAGSTFSAATMQQMWDALLYPYQFPAFTAFSISGVSSPMEVGASFGPGVTFLWSTSNGSNVAANSIDIDDAGTPVVTNTANDGTQAVTLGGAVTRTTAGTHLFGIAGDNSISGTFTLTLTLSWLWRLYYGNDAATSLDEAGIEALAGSTLASGYAGTYVLPATGYKYICFAHAAGGQITSIKDASTNFNVAMSTSGAFTDGGGFHYDKVSVTNANSITTDYRVYRTFNSLGGALTVNVT